MECKQHWFRSDLRLSISPGPLPFAQVENSPEELNGLRPGEMSCYEVSGSTLLLGLTLRHNTCMSFTILAKPKQY